MVLHCLYTHFYTISLQTKKHPGAGFAVGIFVIVTLLIIAVRNHMLRKSRYSSPGTVADLVRRGQLRSDRRGMYGSELLTVLLSC